jgi:signal transduction histidine kinase
MNKLLLIPVIILLLFLGSCTPKTDKNETAINDSIKKYLDLAGNDTLDFTLRNKYNDKAFSLIDLSRNDTLTRFYLSSISYNYMRLNESKKYKNAAEHHLKKSILKKDTLNLARYYRYKAANFKNTFIKDSSYYYYIKAEKLYKKTNDEFGLAVIYLNKSFIQKEINDYLGSELSAFKAYYFFKKNNNDEKLCAVLNQLGSVYIELDEFDKSLKYFNECLNIINKSNIKKREEFKAICLSNIGFVYQRQKKYHKAIKQYTGILQSIRKIEHYPLVYSNTIDNLVSCKLAIKDLKNLPKLLFESLKIRKEINEPSAIITSLFHVSVYYKTIGKDTLAEKYANEALKKAIQSKNTFDYLQALGQLTTINKSYIPKYFEVYIKINDSFQISERKARNNFARIEFETEEITQEKETAIKQKWGIIIVSGVVITIIILLLIITRQRSKQKEMQLLQSQQKANEEIYDLMLVQKSKEEQARQSEKKRIAIELHDGVMNKLASTRLNLDILNHKSDKQTITKCLTHVAEIYLIEQEIRNIAHDLSIEDFKSNNSFVVLIDDFVGRQNGIFTANYKLEIDSSIKWDSMSSSIKMNLYRIIQEASHNINKFAEAQNAVISLVLDGKNICLSITDDGKGFDSDIVTEGIGLKNIKRRVETMDGKFVIQSIKSKTTSLNIAIPWDLTNNISL